MRSVAAALLCLAAVLCARPSVAQDLPPQAYPAPPSPDQTPVAPSPGDAPPPGVQPGPAPVDGQPYAPPARLAPVPSTRETQRVAIYGELLGKGLFYGVGFDLCMARWLAIGVVGSYYKVESWEAGIVAPYLTVYPVAGQRNAMLVQAGPEIFISGGNGKAFSVWSSDDTIVVGHASLGYEYRNGFLFRVALSAFFNELGFIVWPGVSFGGAF